jgi:glycosyl transferase family 1
VNILLLCVRTGRGVDARTVTDHLDAFQRYSRHNVRELSFFRELPSALELERFDAVVLHYTVAIGWMPSHYLGAASRQRLREYRGLKVVFIQDEYHGVHQLHEQLRTLGVDVLFTVVPEAEIEKVYPASALPGVTRVSNLTGYVPESLVSTPVEPVARRPIDVGYRARQPPFWLGQLAYEKWQIAERFKRQAAGRGLKLDLSYVEGERLYGPAWTRFVASCKAVLGAESGASVFDFDGTIRPAVEDYVARNPDATFAEVQSKLLAPHEGKVRYNQISPRCFEAAALRTAMVLYQGEYSRVLKPWRHFVPLRKDFSNFEEVVDAIRDEKKLQEMAERTYAEVACNEAYSYRGFVRMFDDNVEQEFRHRGKKPAARPYSAASHVAQLARSPGYVAHRLYSPFFQRLLLAPGRRRFMMKIWYGIPSRERERIRPLLRRLLGR